MTRMRTLMALTALAAGAAAAIAAGPETSQRKAEQDFQAAAQTPLLEIRRSAAPVAAPAGKRASTTLIIPASHRDRDRGRRDLDCRGYDRGWEEHWGGHGGRGYSPGEACSECRRRHGSCTYRCTEPAYRCTSQWEEGDSRREYEGRRRSDRYDAEDDAMNRCRDANWDNRERGRCRILRCESEDETVDSGRC